MRERPILFSSPMVRAILDGRKTQTRRVVKPVGNDDGFVILDHGNGGWPYRSDDGDSATHTVKRGGKLYLDETPHDCPYGQPGDRLWVRETWGYRCTAWHGAKPDTHTHTIEYQADGARIDFDREINDASGLPKQRKYQADEDYQEYYRDYLTRYWKAWRPSIHMPRWASRILLEVVSVRVERLADISKDDAMAEGIVLQPDGGFGLADSTHYHFTDPTDSYCSLWESINGAGSWLANPWVWVVEFKRMKGGSA